MTFGLALCGAPLLLLALVSCAQTTTVTDRTSTAPGQSRLQAVSPSWGADVGMSPELTLFQLDPGEYWKPDNRVIREMRRKLTEKVHELCNSGAPMLSKAMEKYNCQHIGVTEGTSRSVWTLCMCRVPEDWQTRFLRVHGGGDCYVEGSALIDALGGLHVDWLKVHRGYASEVCREWTQGSG